jgi:FixJ family two-component response regulator
VLRYEESRNTLHPEVYVFVEDKVRSEASLCPEAVVYVVDDDESIRIGLSGLLRSAGMQVHAFDSPDEFLATEIRDVPGCLILDVRLRCVNGLMLQREKLRERIRIPVIFLTAYGDMEMSVQAMKAGAFDFLTKPYRDQHMLDTVVKALSVDAERRDRERLVADIQSKFELLSSREREVVLLVAKGMMNKQIADRMCLSEVTVKVYRSQALRKLEAHSVPDLIRKLHQISVSRR